MEAISNHVEYLSLFGSQEASISWTIKNFSLCELQTGTMLKSETFPKFGDYGCQWYLKFYPHGETYGPNMNTRLAFIPKKMENVVANLTVSLSTKDKEICTENSDKCRFTSDKGISFTFVRDEVIPHLKDDVLIIKCSIKWNTEIECPQPKFELLNDQNQLSIDFKRLAEEGTFSDVSIFAKDGIKFLAHKGVLAARSPVFAAMFEHDMKEKQESVVKIEDFDADVVKQILQFIYSSKVDEKACDMGVLLAAADKYDLKQLKSFCEYKLCEKLQIDNVGTYLLLADKHDAKILKMRSLELLKTYPKDIFNTEAMDNLSYANSHLFNESIKAVFN